MQSGAEPAEPEQNATINERPSAESRTQPPREAATVIKQTGASGLTSATAVKSPLEALRRAEILSTKQFCRIGFGIGVAGAIVILMLPGNPVATEIVEAVVGAAL